MKKDTNWISLGGDVDEDVTTRAVLMRYLDCMRRARANLNVGGQQLVAVESVLWSRYVLNEAGAGEMRGRMFCKGQGRVAANV